MEITAHPLSTGGEHPNLKTQSPKRFKVKTRRGGEHLCEIPALPRLRRENREFKAWLDCLKKQNKTKNEMLYNQKLFLALTGCHKWKIPHREIWLHAHKH
jgi:hypothetical protein